MNENDKERFVFPSLRNEVETLFNQVLGTSSPRVVPHDFWNPQLDMTEEKDRFAIEMDLPGVRHEDLSIEVKGRTLIIAGLRKVVRRKTGELFSHCERYSGSFRRSFTLPREVDGDRVTARLEEGILHLELPKKGAQR